MLHIAFLKTRLLFESGRFPIGFNKKLLKKFSIFGSVFFQTLQFSSTLDQPLILMSYLHLQGGGGGGGSCNKLPSKHLPFQSQR